MGSAATKTAARRVRFGDLATCVNDRVDNPSEAGVERYVGLEHLDPESLRIRRWGAPTDVEASKLLFRKGDIIFGRRRAYQRKLAVADFDGICSAHAMVLRARPEMVVPEFLPFFMQSAVFMERALAISVGSLSPTINWKTLAQEEFVLPPLEEQRRLTALLVATDSQLESLRDVVMAASRLRTSTIEDLIGRHLNAGAKCMCLVDGCLRVTDGTHQPPKFTDDGVPFFLVKTISSGFVDWSHTKFVSQQTYDELTRRVRPKRGDVLYTAVGATYGVALLVDFDEPFVFQRHIAHIIPDPKILTGRYVELYLNSRQGKRQSDKSAIGSAQPTVTLGSLSKFQIPALSLGEQHALAARVDHIDRCLLATETRIGALKSTRAAVLGRAFA